MFSAYSRVLPSIPRETFRAASASFGRGNFYIQVGEHLDNILGEVYRPNSLERCGGLSKEEQLSLALITFFQFVEGLTDVQASDAVRTRIDWKFALHLSLLPRTLDENALCRFREEILSNAADQQAYQVLIDGLVRAVPLLPNHFQRLKSLDLVSQVCSVNRWNQIHQAMIRALEVLAARFPQWLRAIALPHWYGRYNPAMARFDGSVLAGQQQISIEDIGSDIQLLLEKIHQSGPQEISELHELRFLEQVWLRHAQTLKTPPADRLKLSNYANCENCSQKGTGGRQRA